MMTEPIAQLDDLRLSLSELLDNRPATLLELYDGLVRRCGYGELLETVDVLEALDDLVAFGWVRQRHERSTVAPSDVGLGRVRHARRYELRDPGRRSFRAWVEQRGTVITADRWALDHDRQSHTVTILADGYLTAVRVLRWWSLLQPDIALLDETISVTDIGEFRSRDGAPSRGGVRVDARYAFLC